MDSVDEDLLAPGQISEDLTAVRASINAELDLERRWREYVSGSPLGSLQKVMLVARGVKRRVSLAPYWRREVAETEAGPRMLRRLANIELAHLEIMRRAVKSQARWVLILEDDAMSDDPQALASALVDFCRAADGTGSPVTINLSESFTPRELGIGHLLSARTNPGQPGSWLTFESARLVTNTVCAVLYRHDFLDLLLQRLESIPLEPVVPIDFKVNIAYMDWPNQVAGQCWVCSPAPIAQGSGVPRTVL
jgi:hypothetical protein